MSSFGSVRAGQRKSVEDLVRSCHADEALPEGMNDQEEEEPDARTSSSDKLQRELAQDELTVRKTSERNVIYMVFVNGYASVVVFLWFLVSIESLISIGLSVGLTIYTYNRIKDDDEDADGTDSIFDGSIMNWVLLSFAVITPISSTIGMAFRRRETALADIASMRASFIELFTAHALWDWSQKPGDVINSGRTKSTIVWASHCDQLLYEIEGICKDLTRFLTLPNFTRARHKITRKGEREANDALDVASRLHLSIIHRFRTLATYCETLKREGLPGNEAARIRQWERLLLEKVERLRMVKLYRTPQALRSFSRLFSIFLPPFYVPYYAQMAKELNSLGTAIAFSVITSLALTSLFEAVTQMEDPFVQISVLDGVSVKYQLVDSLLPQLQSLRESFFVTQEDPPIDSTEHGAVQDVNANVRAPSTMRLLGE